MDYERSVFTNQVGELKNTKTKIKKYKGNKPAKSL